MSFETDLIDKLKQLPEDKQLLVKTLVDGLARSIEEPAGRGQRGWFGGLEGLGITITEADISVARLEMWGNFPREVSL